MDKLFEDYTFKTVGVGNLGKERSQDWHKDFRLWWLEDIMIFYKEHYTTFYGKKKWKNYKQEIKNDFVQGIKGNG